ncbi:MAG: large conductance mechanosensitive channel protein MscL [Sphingobacteriales bacterium]|nr:MAG: large conductance mechanosensitive channel protein MscL [Sphingobacteriales bacterium]
MEIFKEFKEFAIKGNVIDLAVGVIIGAAFGKIVNSVVEDLIMPIVGIFFNADFRNLYVPLSSSVSSGLALADAKKLGPVFAYGNFITEVINFTILALIIFLLIKVVNKIKRKEEEKEIPAAPPLTKQEILLSEIRDLLRK